MSVGISDFQQAFVLLLDINGFSELSDDAQVKLIRLVNKVTDGLISNGGYQKEKIIRGYATTGDGFYLIGDYVSSQVWSQVYIFLAFSLRNAILRDVAQTKDKLGVKIAIHFGRVLRFLDITGRPNFIGSALNECSRLLNPENREEVQKIKATIHNHDNFVIVSQVAFDKIPGFSDSQVRVSSTFSIRTKHGKTLECRLLEMDLSHVYNLYTI
jgi:hypothetical protein